MAVLDSTVAKAFAVILLIGAVVGGGIMLGFIDIDIGGISGQFSEPTVGFINSSVTEYGTDSFTSEIYFYINNSNPVGGTIDVIEYNVSWSETRNGTYTHLGEDKIKNLTVPRDNNTTYRTTTQFRSDEAIEAKSTLETQGYIYVRLDGEARFAFVKNFVFPFNRTMRMEG